MEHSWIGPWHRVCRYMGLPCNWIRPTISRRLLGRTQQTDPRRHVSLPEERKFRFQQGAPKFWKLRWHFSSESTGPKGPTGSAPSSHAGLRKFRAVEVPQFSVHRHISGGSWESRNKWTLGVRADVEPLFSADDCSNWLDSFALNSSPSRRRHPSHWIRSSEVHARG